MDGVGKDPPPPQCYNEIKSPELIGLKLERIILGKKHIKMHKISLLNIIHKEALYILKHSTYCIIHIEA